MDLSHLVKLCANYLSDNNSFFEMPPGLLVYRREAASYIEASVYEPVVCLILQGSKTANIADEFVELEPGDALLVSHDLPVVSRITRASLQDPYLALILSLDLVLARSLSDQMTAAPEPETRLRSLSVGQAEQAWVEPLVRYFELMGNAQDARILGPTVLREVHYRLLLSPMGRMLRQLLTVDSQASRIAKAISRLRTEFRSPIGVPDLAATASMSVSTFHQHFKSVTGMTPIQYLKDLRLITAKAMLMSDIHSVTEVSYAVGYESPTHFSRDYRRKFGVPPSRDAGIGRAARRPARREHAD